MHPCQSINACVRSCVLMCTPPCTLLHAPRMCRYRMRPVHATAAAACHAAVRAPCAHATTVCHATTWAPNACHYHVHVPPTVWVCCCRAYPTAQCALPWRPLRTLPCTPFCMPCHGVMHCYNFGTHLLVSTFGLAVRAPSHVFFLQSFDYAFAKLELARQRHQPVPTQNLAIGTVTNNPHPMIPTSSGRGVIYRLDLPLQIAIMRSSSPN